MRMASRETVAKWLALPHLVFWLAIVLFVSMNLVWMNLVWMNLVWMNLVCLTLPGWAHTVAGHYSAVVIAMTVLIGFACRLGIGLAHARSRTSAIH
jgi:hypothetical protein